MDRFESLLFANTTLDVSNTDISKYISEYNIHVVWGALVAQWVKCWPVDLPVPGLNPAEARIFSSIEVAHSLSLLPNHHLDMAEILLKRT